MKSSIHQSDPAFIEYLPDDYKTTNHTDEVFNFICKLYLETKQPIRPIQIREGTTLQKTAVQRHLNILVEQNLLSQRFGKFKYPQCTVISGCYEPTKHGIEVFGSRTNS